jgi:hypothetical protein
LRSAGGFEPFLRLGIKPARVFVLPFITTDNSPLLSIVSPDFFLAGLASAH